MEFFIKKNATLPVLKLQVVKDGRSDYNSFMKTIEESAIFFSMVDVDTGIPKISSRPAGFVEKTLLDPNASPEYYIYYQFTNKDTNRVGRYEGQFMLRNDDGVLIVPIRESLFINVQESFIADDLEYSSCYVSEFPCCLPYATTTTTNPPITTTTTEPPVTTSTTTITPPYTTSTTTSSCLTCTTGSSLPPIGQSRTYNGVLLTGSGSGYVSGSQVPSIPTCYSNWDGPVLGTTFLGRLNTTIPSPFIYELSFGENVNNVSFRFINYSGFPPMYRETFTITLYQDNVEVPLTINPCEYCCAEIIGNTILATDGSGCQNGSGIFRFETEVSFNKVKIEGPGGGGGTFLDVCQDSIIPV
jgi:hypothetical protein